MYAYIIGCRFIGHVRCSVSIFLHVISAAARIHATKQTFRGILRNNVPLARQGQGACITGSLSASKQQVRQQAEERQIGKAADKSSRLLPGQASHHSHEKCHSKIGIRVNLYHTYLAIHDILCSLSYTLLEYPTAGSLPLVCLLKSHLRTSSTHSTELAKQTSPKISQSPIASV